MTTSFITNVALVDDHTLVRKGLVALVNGLPGYQVVLEASNGKEFTVALHDAPRVDIAIVDLNMPVMDGYTTIKWIVRNTAGIKPIALTFDASENAVIRTVREGARGFLLKTVEPAQFKLALDQVRDTGYCSEDPGMRPLQNSDALLTSYERRRAKILSALTERELRIIRYICAPEEYTYEAIANLMNVQFSTIDTHRRNLFERFGIKSKAGMVIFAYQWGIVKVDTD